jgi:hypothetical protein
MSIAPFSCYIRVAIPPQLQKWENFWLQISGYWLYLSKKFNGSVNVSLLLDLVKLSSGHEDTNIQNSLFLESSVPTGSHKLYLSSLCRIEIIQVFQAITVGCGYLNSVFLAEKFREPAECSYTSGGLLKMSKHSKKLILTGKDFIVSGQKQYPISSIISVSPKQNDQNCQSKLIVTIQTADAGPQQKEFSGLHSQELTKMCITFLMRAKDMTQGKIQSES